VSVADAGVKRAEPGPRLDPLEALAARLRERRVRRL